MKSSKKLLDKILPGLSNVIDVKKLGLGLYEEAAVELVSKLVLNSEKKEKKASRKASRKAFSKTTKKLVLISQDCKCASCKNKLEIVDFDHIDGNRSNNSALNCQALCPNCHAKKTRLTKR